MKACAIILSYGLVPKLRDAIASVNGVDTFVLNPTHSWWSDEMKDHTRHVANGTGVRIVRDSFASETEARNFSVNMAQELGYDYAILLDSDEVLVGLNTALDIISATQKDVYGCAIVDYAPDDITPLPKRSHRPVMAVRAGYTRFYDKRCIHGDMEVMPSSVFIKHYSLSELSKEEWKYKIESPRYDDEFPPKIYRDFING